MNQKLTCKEGAKEESYCCLCLDLVRKFIMRLKQVCEYNGGSVMVNGYRSSLKQKLLHKLKLAMLYGIGTKLGVVKCQ